MTVRSSIVRCLEQDSSILPGYEGESQFLDYRSSEATNQLSNSLIVHNGVIASEIVPHVASFDMDCILASQEDGLNGLSKVRLCSDQLLLCAN